MKKNRSGITPGEAEAERFFFLDTNPNKPLAMQVDPKSALSPR